MAHNGRVLVTVRLAVAKIFHKNLTLLELVIPSFHAGLWRSVSSEMFCCDVLQQDFSKVFTLLFFKE